MTLDELVKTIDRDFMYQGQDAGLTASGREAMGRLISSYVIGVLEGLEVEDVDDAQDREEQGYNIANTDWRTARDKLIQGLK